MLVHILILLLYTFNVESLVQNVTCPAVSPREIDLQRLSGKWYLAATTDNERTGDCAIVVFNHRTDNDTDISINWTNNNTIYYYNGTVMEIEDPTYNNSADLLSVIYSDKETDTYYILDVNYGHYAVIFACYNNHDGNTSTYMLWKLSRTPHIKDEDAAKINQALADYYLENTKFFYFNNTEETCYTNGGIYIRPSSLILTSAAAITLFRRLY